MILATRWILGPLINDKGVFSWIWGARVVSGIFGAASVVVIWLLAKCAFDNRVAGVSAILFAALPLFRQNAADTLSDAPHLFFYLLSAWMGAEGFLRRNYLWFSGAGLASGLAYWIRPEGLSVAIVLAMLLLFWRDPRVRMQRKTLLLSLCGLTFGAIVIAAPYMILSGKFTSKKDPLKLVAGGTEQKQDLLLLSLVKGASPIFREVVHGFCYVLLFPLCLGLFARGRRRGNHATSFLFGMLLIFHILILLGLYALSHYIADRHVFPIVAFALPWISSGTIYFANELRSLIPVHYRYAQLNYSDWVLGLVLFLLLAGMVPRSLRPLNRDHLSVMEAAQWVGAHAGPGDAVLSNSPYVPFYADLPGGMLDASDAAIAAMLPGASAYRFVILESGSKNFRSDWIAQLSARYRQVDLRWKHRGEQEVILLHLCQSAF
jgi:4-amino-4-deoxy-L-arabinose transferase-like glycosyltransferase